MTVVLLSPPVLLSTALNLAPINVLSDTEKIELKTGKDVFASVVKFESVDHETPPVAPFPLSPENL